MKRLALLTGAGGFLGGFTAAALERSGFRVAASRHAGGRFACDLKDRAATRRLVLSCRPELIVHAAGTTRPADWGELWDLHVGATANLLEAVLALPRPEAVRVIVAGSAAAYGDAAGKRAAAESGPASPLAPYGASKLSQGLAALGYRHRGLDIIVARIFNSCGPGSPAHLVPGAFARQIVEIERRRKSPRLEVGNLDSRRDFVDVRDIASALASLADRGVASGLYNVCSQRAITIRAVLDILIALSNQEIAVRRDPARRRGHDLPFIVGDGRKLARATGWRPRYSLERSLRDTLTWHRAQSPA